MKARSDTPKPAELGLQVTLCVNGRSHETSWRKGGFNPGIRAFEPPLRTGVLFAAAMAGAVLLQPRSTVSGGDDLQPTPAAGPFPAAPGQRSMPAQTSYRLRAVGPSLGEMLQEQRCRSSCCRPLSPGAPRAAGTWPVAALAPANRRSWHWLDSTVQLNQTPSQGLLELLVDPQTCGPLLLACPESTAASLLSEGPWRQIGIAAVEA